MNREHAADAGTDRSGFGAVENQPNRFIRKRGLFC